MTKTPPDTDPPPTAPIDMRVFVEIGAIGVLSQSALEDLLPDGLTASQFRVLSHLIRVGQERAPAELALNFRVSKGAMTNTLQRLEAHGFVSVRGDPLDGRKKRVAVTPAGVAIQRASMTASHPKLEALRAHISEAEFASVLPFLVKLRSWLDRGR